MKSPPVRRFSTAMLAVVSWCVAFLGVPISLAAEETDAVVAKVGDQPVYLSEIARSLESVASDRQFPAQIRSRLEAEVLEQLVRRRLVEELLLHTKKLVDSPTVDAQLQQLDEKLAAQDRKLSDVLAKRDVTLDQYRRELRWELSWQKFVADTLTDEQLKDYFQQHRRHFDGSQVRASHILLRPIQPSNPRQIAQTIGRARQLREEITSGKVTFAEAAKKYSDGPSGAAGGDLGFIPRHGVMVEAFSRAAFDLEPDEVSQPVLTQFGIHLIQVTEVKSGGQTWQQARAELRAEAAKELFQQLAESQREKTTVVYTGNCPYIEQESGRLVLPSGESH